MPERARGGELMGRSDRLMHRDEIREAAELHRSVQGQALAGTLPRDRDELVSLLMRVNRELGRTTRDADAQEGIIAALRLELADCKRVAP
jgi:hypothetical protein